MIKVAVIDDYQNAFQQIVDTEKNKDKFDFKVFNEPFVNEKEATKIRRVLDKKVSIFLMFPSYYFRIILIKTL